MVSTSAAPVAVAAQIELAKMAPSGPTLIAISSGTGAPVRYQGGRSAVGDVETDPSEVMTQGPACAAAGRLVRFLSARKVSPSATVMPSCAGSAPTARVSTPLA